MNQYIKQVGIAGTGYHLPEKVMTNADLCAFMKTSPSWIEEKIGIKERRVANDEESLSDLALPAAKQAMKNARVTAEEIDLIIVCAINQDKRIPSTANIMQSKLGANNASAFDINVGGCPGTVYALTVGEQFVATGMHKCVLVISGEIYSKLLDWSDRNISMFFGDGVGAAILKPCKPEKGILSSLLGSDSDWGAEKVVMEGGSLHSYTEEMVKNNQHRIWMDNREVWKFGTTIFPKIVRQASNDAGIGLDSLDLVIPHQANINMIRHGMNSMGLDISKAFTNLEYIGNTGAGSVIIALADAVEQGVVKENDHVALASFGAGFSWGASVVKWCGQEDFA